MNDAYLLQQLVTRVEAYLKAQHENAKYPGDPKKDRLKESYLTEVRRRREDVNAILSTIRKARAIPQNA